MDAARPRNLRSRRPRRCARIRPCAPTVGGNRILVQMNSSNGDGERDRLNQMNLTLVLSVQPRNGRIGIELAAPSRWLSYGPLPRYLIQGGSRMRRRARTDLCG